MDKVIGTKEFDNKFKELNVDNQRYIIAIRQALIFAQSYTEECSKENQECQGVLNVLCTTGIPKH